VALVATAVKLVVAANTYGSLDVRYFTEFAAGVREFGPIGVYGHDFTEQYNHPPLIGWMLLTIAWLVDNGVAGLPMLIRVPSSLADPVTALLVFELVRRQRTVRNATVAGLLVAASPALVVISGFHGNTDPVFVMFSLLAVYLLAVPRWAAGAGVAIALALSVKLVPVVIVPVLLLAVVRLGRRQVAAFVAGSGAVFLILWAPALIMRWEAVRSDVLGYSGVAGRSQWGIVRLATWVGLPDSAVDVLTGPGRFAALLLSAGAPVVLLLRRPAALVPAAGLGLTLFLLLCTTFGMQYLAWPLAAAYLVSTTGATVYNVLASGLVVTVYDHWNDAYPWNWYYAHPKVFRPAESVLAGTAWAALALVVLLGGRRLRVPAVEPDEPAASRADGGRAHVGVGLRRVREPEFAELLVRHQPAGARAAQGEQAGEQPGAHEDDAEGHRRG
jgi:Dolichyl-phosphate-mannose-protein mannosyltransferase